MPANVVSIFAQSAAASADHATSTLTTIPASRNTVTEATRRLLDMRTGHFAAYRPRSTRLNFPLLVSAMLTTARKFRALVL